VHSNAHSVKEKRNTYYVNFYMTIYLKRREYECVYVLTIIFLLLQSLIFGIFERFAQRLLDKFRIKPFIMEYHGIMHDIIKGMHLVYNQYIIMILIY
jgi:hypothetical protein